VSEQTDLSNEGVEVINAGAKAPLVLVCEHAAREIPACFDGLGLDAAARESHVAWDPGALAVARAMGQDLDAVLVAGRVAARLRLQPPARSPRRDASAKRDFCDPRQCVT